MILCGTGHRPEKLTPLGNDIYIDGLEELEDRLEALCVVALERFKPEKVISGMALGYDTALAQAAIKLGIPWVAAIPYQGQESKWSHRQQARYQELLARATEIKIVNPGSFAYRKLNSRNEWMVNQSELVLALWNGQKSGTAHCVNYANDQGVEVNNLWDNWKRHSGFWT